jgi:hypothetical protein
MEVFLVEGSGFLDPKTFEHQGKDLWLIASESPSQFAAPALKRLHSSGCKTSGTDPRGWNCLFMCIMNTFDSLTSRDLDKLEFLLSVYDDIHARDYEGHTIFDLVNKDINKPPWGEYYRRDLWYCALQRASIDISNHLARHPRIAAYSHIYPREHYHALKHLQSWDRSNLRFQMDRLLEEIPLDEEEYLEVELQVEKKSSKRETEEESDEDEYNF